MKTHTAYLIGMLAALSARAASIPLAQYLAPPPDPDAQFLPVPAGEEVVCASGVHKGHRIMETRLPALRGRRDWRPRYNICLSRDDHSNMIEVWPRESMSGIGLSGTAWYGGGCIDVKIDGHTSTTGRPVGANCPVRWCTWCGRTSLLPRNRLQRNDKDVLRHMISARHHRGPYLRAGQIREGVANKDGVIP